METILFEPVKFDQLYGCHQLSDEEWLKYRNPNVVVGTFYIILATIYQLAYFPFLVAMLKRDFIKHSHYKMMFLLGIIDVLATLDGGTIMGYFLIKGDIWCTNKTLFFYAVSGLTGALWAGACAAGLVLTIHKISLIFYPDSYKKLFSGYKIIFWLFMPIVFIFYNWFFTPTFLINSNLGAVFSDPFVGVENTVVHPNHALYENKILMGINMIVVITFPLLYVLLCATFLMKRGKAESLAVMEEHNHTLAKVTFIGFFKLLTAALYSYMQYFYTPYEIILLAHFAWQASHGCAVLAYILFDKELRNAVIEMISYPIEKKRSFIEVSAISGFLDEA